MSSLVDKYLEAIGLGVTGQEGSSTWPLLPAQISPYYEADQAIEIFEILTETKKTYKNEKIAHLFHYPGVIRNYLRNAGIIGLKVANKFGIKKYSVKEKTEYLEFLISLIRELVYSDPLCTDGKNYLLSTKEQKSLLDGPWKSVNEDKRDINGFYSTLFGWIWATHFNIFVESGLEVHGPYDASQKFGNDMQILVRDFHGVYCPEVWPISARLPFKKIRIYQMFKSVKLRINFEEQIITEDALGNNLVAYFIECDGQIITDTKKVMILDETITRLVSQQTEIVNNMKPLEQVRKAAQISYFHLKDIYKVGGKEWWNEKNIDANIKRFGDSFLKMLGSQKSFSRPYFKIVNDPRNDLLGDDALKAI